MSTLHIISANGAALARCLHAAATGDTVLLIGNGVYCSVAADFERLLTRAKGIALCALIGDLERRGIVDRLPGVVRPIEDGDFVDLVSNHRPIVSWAS
jgi:tRNA 2-thiouridine synthesizing protein B